MAPHPHMVREACEKHNVELVGVVEKVEVTEPDFWQRRGHHVDGDE